MSDQALFDSISPAAGAGLAAGGVAGGLAGGKALKAGQNHMAARAAATARAKRRITPGAALNAALLVGFPAYEFMSGNNSLGGTIGSAAGGLYGWNLGERLLDKYIMPPTPYGEVRAEKAIDNALAKVKLHNPENGVSPLAKAITNKKLRGVLRFGTAMIPSMLLAHLGQVLGDDLLGIRRGKTENTQQQYPQNLGGSYNVY